MKLTVFLLTTALALPVSALSQTVVIGTTDCYTTGNYTVAATTLQGFEKALGEALCARGKLACEWKVMAQDALLPALNAREIDLILAAIPANADLGDDIDLTAPYLAPDPFDLVSRPGRDPHGDVKSFAAVRDPAIEAWHATTGFNATYVQTADEALKLLDADTVDLAVAEKVDVAPLLAAYDGRIVIVQDSRRLRPGMAMAFHADNIDMRFTFEDLIYDMSQDGSLNALSETWFGLDAYRW